MRLEVGSSRRHSHRLHECKAGMYGWLYMPSALLRTLSLCLATQAFQVTATHQKTEAPDNWLFVDQEGVVIDVHKTDVVSLTYVDETTQLKVIYECFIALYNNCVADRSRRPSAEVRLRVGVLLRHAGSLVQCIRPGGHPSPVPGGQRRRLDRAGGPAHGVGAGRSFRRPGRRGGSQGVGPPCTCGNHCKASRE